MTTVRAQGSAFAVKGTGDLSLGDRPAPHFPLPLLLLLSARFASDASTLFLPLGGLYLAGGTVQKDLRWLERDSLFMKYFEKNYNPNIRPLLNKIPVYIIKDYSISLYGAANASLNLQK